MPDQPAPQRPPLPLSMTGHTVPDERLPIVAAHIEMLSMTALKVSDELPLEVDAWDFVRMLEREQD